MPEDNWWSSLPYAPTNSTKKAGGKVASEDLKELRAASARAEAERDARQTYSSTRRAVEAMDTGPWKARWLDAITPDGDGGWADTIGGVLGAPFRALVSDSTMAARAELATNSARSTMHGANQMRGTPSNRDAALARIAAVSADKPRGENLRILAQAQRESELAQTRARFKSNWISSYGSMAQANPGGQSYEDGLASTERQFLSNYSQRQRRGLPKPPPSRRSQGGPIEIDLQGNRLQ
jgi:hypothetical protein